MSSLTFHVNLHRPGSGLSLAVPGCTADGLGKPGDIVQRKDVSLCMQRPILIAPLVAMDCRVSFSRAT